MTSIAARSGNTCWPDPSAPIEYYPGGGEDLLSVFQMQPAEQVAISADGQNYTYEQICGYADFITRQLRTARYPAHSVIGIHGPRSAAFVCAVLGLVRLPAPFCVLDPSYPAARLVVSARAAGVDCILCVGEPALRNQEFLSTMRTLGVRTIYIPAWGEVQREDQFAGLLESPGREDAPGPRNGYILFTSGSSGTPKAIRTGLAPLSHFIQWYLREFQFGARARFTMLSGLGHDPILRDIFAPLCEGATLCIPPQGALLSPKKLLAWLEDEKVTVMHLTPQLGRMIAQEAERTCHARAAAPPLAAVRYTFFGGDVLTYRDVRQWKNLAPQAVCVNFYGATETPQAVGYHVVDEADLLDPSIDDARRVPVGKGISEVQLLVLRDDMSLAAEAEEGEICVRTPHLSDGYVGDPAGTAQRFVTNPFTHQTGDRVYRTGDRGRFLADGSVELHGRIDDQVKVRGFRVEIAEVESLLKQLEAVADAAVVAVPHPVMGSELVAHLVLSRTTSGGANSPDHLSERLRKELLLRCPEYMVPTRLRYLERIPLGANGKTDRKALLQREQAAQERVGAKRPEKSSSFEDALVDTWKRFFGANEITPDSDFLLVGGNSLTAVCMANEVEAATGLAMDPSLFFERRTFGRICRAMAGAATEAVAPQGRASTAPGNGGGNPAALTKLRERVEACRLRASNDLRPPPVPRASYSMRESLFARVFLAAAYRIGGRVVREGVERMILKLEGGAWFTLTLRRLYRVFYNMDIGHYSSYCFSAGNFKPGTTFGRYCDVTRTARFETANHPSNSLSVHGIFYQKGFGFSEGVAIPRKRITVGNDVHIGHNAVVLYPTQSIGDGAIIAAGAVVTTDVPPYAIVAGYPARVVRLRFSESIVQQLCQMRWWELSLEELREVRHLFERPLEGETLK